LEVPVTLRDAPNRDVAFIIAAFPLVKTFRVAMFARVLTVMLVAFDVTAFMTSALALVKTFRVAMFARV
jgi:hypothetical protein